MPKLHIYKNEKETFNAAADWMVDLMRETIDSKGRFAIALSLHETPAQIFKILATQHKEKVDWSKVYLFLGDAGLVSLKESDGDGKEGVKHSLFDLPLVDDQIHVIKTDVGPEEAAKDYENLLHDFFKEQETTFDLVLLSIGENGNTLSLFPGNDANTESISWVIPVYNKEEDLYRITLTSPVINSASVKAFIVTGKNKQEVVQQVLKGKYQPEKYPAQLIQTANKTVHWFLDEGAAGKLLKPAP